MRWICIQSLNLLFFFHKTLVFKAVNFSFKLQKNPMFSSGLISLSIYLSIYLYIYLLSLSFYISIFLSFFLSIFSSFYLSIHLSIYLFIHLSIYPSINLSIHPYIHLSIYPSIHLSIYLSIYLSRVWSVGATWLPRGWPGRGRGSRGRTPVAVPGPRLQRQGEIPGISWKRFPPLLVCSMDR